MHRQICCLRYLCNIKAVSPRAFLGWSHPGTLLTSESSNLLPNLEAHAASRPNLISPSSSLWGPESLGLAASRVPPYPFAHTCSRRESLARTWLFLWPKNRHLHNDTSKMMLFLQETVKLQEKRREPKMQFNTQFQAHYLSLSINLAMVQKVAHNSLKCWLNTSSAQHYFLSQ